MTVRPNPNRRVPELAKDLQPGHVVNGCTIQRTELRPHGSRGQKVVVFYTAPNHVGRHRKAECTLGVTTVDLFEGVGT